MIKTGLSLLIGLIISMSGTHQAWAQIKVDKSHTYDIYGNIRSNGNHIYTYNQVNKTFDKKELIIYDITGEQLNRIELQSRLGFDLIEGVASGSGTLFYFKMKTTILLIKVDQNGSEILRKEYDYGKISDLKMYAIEDGFYITGQVKVKKVGTGVRIERLDANFNTVWTYDNIPEKGKHFHRLTAIDDNGTIGFVYQLGNSKKYKLVLVDATGVALADVQINSSDLSDFEPYRTQFLASGELILISDAGATNNTVFMKMPTAVSVKRFSSITGVEVSSQTLKFDDVQNDIGDKREDGTPVYTESPALRVVDIHQVNGKNQLICESYLMRERKESVRATSSSTTATIISYKQITMMDLYILDVANINGGLNRIWKPKRTIEMDGQSFTTAVRYCNKMENNHLFSYQFIQGNQIIVRGFSQNYEYFNAIPLDAKHDGILTRTYWGDPISGKRVASNFTQTFKTSSVGNKPNINRNGLLQLDNGFMIYHYDGITNLLEFSFTSK